MKPNRIRERRGLADLCLHFILVSATRKKVSELENVLFYMWGNSGIDLSLSIIILNIILNISMHIKY